MPGFPRNTTTKAIDQGLAKGFRSGLEGKVSKQLATAGMPSVYEGYRLGYVVPTRKATYTPDFLLKNGIIIETKGRFISDDRHKHVWIKEQHPRLDIRFVFSNPNTKLYKGSPTSYAKWCDDHGFKYAAKRIPDAWLSEPPSAEAIDAALAVLVPVGSGTKTTKKPTGGNSG